MNPLRHLRNRKVLAVLAFVAFLLAVALWPSAVPVDLAPVERGTLLVTVEEEGETATMTPAGTVAGTVLGTMGYMSPEQLRGEPSDARSDIFALGCVLYEMLSGQSAFLRKSTAETSAAILKEEPERLSSTGTVLPADVERSIHRCLEKSREARFQSASDLAFNLKSISTDQVISPVTEAEEPPAGKRKRTAWIVGFVAVGMIAAVALWINRSPPVEETQEASIPRIVVLPFENLGSPDDEYFADGITEELISRLAAVSGLQVISRTSALYYKDRRLPVKQIGEELDVGYVLEGTIRWDRSGDGYGRVRITPQLIKVADDSHLWGDRYDRVLEDIFAVQTNIAEQVIAKLQATILEPERRAIEAHPTENMEAYQAYLLGVQYRLGSYEERSVRLEVESCERAVKLDPGFAVAHAELSIAHSRLYHFRYDFTEERLESAKSAADRALALQSDLPEAHLALGYYYYWGLRNFERALEHLAIAAERLPNDPTLLTAKFAVLRRQGRWEDAIEVLAAWRRIDPQGYQSAFESLTTYMWIGEHDLAEREMHRAIIIAPDIPDAYFYGALNYLKWSGDTDAARNLMESAQHLGSQYIDDVLVDLDLYERNPESALARLQGVPIEGFVSAFWCKPRDLLGGICFSRMGEWQRAEAACTKAIGRLDREIEVAPHDFRLYIAIGQAFALLGRKEQAVRAGQRAVELMPPSKDSIVGPYLGGELAKIYTYVGEHEKALDLLHELPMKPSLHSAATFRLDPVWDPLRDHPRFQALLEKYDTN